jgi:CheY-like chemotaxis protein
MARAQMILVVEDDPANREYATAVLTSEGFEIEAVESAEAALKLIGRRTPDLILMDIQLPGMDGLELTRRLKGDPATEPIPIVVMTGQTMPIHQRAAMAAGAAGFIGKPATPAALASEVRMHVKGQGA